MKNDGGSAFPFDCNTGCGGMTRRQWLAGMAMQGICASYAAGPSDDGCNAMSKKQAASVAALAYEQADAMLEYEAKEAKE